MLEPYNKAVLCNDYIKKEKNKEEKNQNRKNHCKAQGLYYTRVFTWLVNDPFTP